MSKFLETDLFDRASLQRRGETSVVHDTSIADVDSVMPVSASAACNVVTWREKFTAALARAGYADDTSLRMEKIFQDSVDHDSPPADVSCEVGMETGNFMDSLWKMARRLEMTRKPRCLPTQAAAANASM
ncbi:hypothetical protein NE850_36510 [Paraburkholderia sp. USG1]|uniref:hypothetical protein n=1 Tax=Paraburkholderia sp. USG1 TaxID=2952268 RepID=UPI002864DE1F|nr:hypothetical protein [Paraburkholderia sp. USG1]MDR8401838.1 hypothetical protein [Paraburkholderia sp. USG1]